MFTVKLYRGTRIRIASAASFTVVDEGDATLKGVTLHQTNGDDEVYYVGARDPERHSYVDEHRVYDRAIIENGNGKTTEIIYAALPFVRAA